MGLRQILDDSTDSATSVDDGDTVTPDISFTPEEILLRRLQVTAEEQRVIERATIGQHQNVKWFKERCGRLTASKAKRYCGKGNASPMMRSILSAAPKPLARNGIFFSKMQLSIFFTVTSKMTQLHIFRGL